MHYSMIHLFGHSRGIMAGVLSVLIVQAPAVQLLAVPPDPPVKIQIALPMEKPVELRLEMGNVQIPVRIQLRLPDDLAVREQLLRGLVFSVLGSAAHPDSARRPRKLFEQSLRLSSERLAEDVIVTLVAEARADQRLELLVSVRASGGIVDRKILFARRPTEGSIILYTPKLYRRLQQETEWIDFKESLQKDPKNPDIRKLWTPTSHVDDRIVKGSESPEGLLETRPVGPSHGLRSYFEERESNSWEDRDPLTIRGRIVYRDFDGIVRPLPNVSVNIWDSDTGFDDHLGVVGTNWNGYWSFSCNNDDGLWQDGRDIYYTFKLENTRWRVQDCGPWPDATYEWESTVHDNVKDGSTIDFGTETGGSDQDAMIIWAFLNRAWLHAVNVAQQDPGFVDCCFPEDDTQWDRFWEEIDVEAGYSDGPDVVTHEYGHAMMYYAYDEDSPSPGGSHSFADTSQDPGLAWGEGWATGFALSACPDGMFNWHEGSNEGVGEYPICQNQADFGQSIEVFSSTNRIGENCEGRVAAAICDLLDIPNDASGGDANRGRGDRSDGNAAARVPLASMYRDVLWGGYHEDFLEFWASLSGELSGDMLTRGREACQYNWMRIGDAVVCPAVSLVGSASPDAERTLAGIRSFRDIGLRGQSLGRLLIRLYYKHGPEMTRILLSDSTSRRRATEVLAYAASKGNQLEKAIRGVDQSIYRGPFLTPPVEDAITQVLTTCEKQGGKSLRKDVVSIRSIVRSMHGLSLEDIRQRLENKKSSAVHLNQDGQ